MSRFKEEKISLYLMGFGFLFLISVVLMAFVNGWFGAEEIPIRDTPPRSRYVAELNKEKTPRKTPAQMPVFSLSGQLKNTKGQGVQTTDLNVSLDEGAKAVILFKESSGLLNRSISLRTDSKGRFSVLGYIESDHIALEVQRRLSADLAKQHRKNAIKVLSFLMQCSQPDFRKLILAPIKYKNDTFFAELNIVLPE
jgi:hypothetical protein